MKYIIDHDLHLHSQLSRCSNHPEQTPAARVRESGVELRSSGRREPSRISVKKRDTPSQIPMLRIALWVRLRSG